MLGQSVIPKQLEEIKSKDRFLQDKTYFYWQLKIVRHVCFFSKPKLYRKYFAATWGMCQKCLVWEKGGNLLKCGFPRQNCDYTSGATKEGSERRMLDHRLDLRSIRSSTLPTEKKLEKEKTQKWETNNIYSVIHTNNLVTLLLCWYTLLPPEVCVRNA